MNWSEFQFTGMARPEGIMNCVPKEDRALTHEECARRLGITRSAVVRIEQRALRKLRLSLEAIGERLEAHENLHTKKEAA